MEKLMEGAENVIYHWQFWKKFILFFLLQLPINFSYTIDARFVKHAFVIHLSVLIMAFYIESNYGFWIHKNSFFLWFYTILCF